MTILPILLSCPPCRGNHPNCWLSPTQKLKAIVLGGVGSITKKDKLLLGLAAFDVLVMITTLVLGILGAISVISMPSAATGILLFVGGAFTSIWIALTCLSKGENLYNLKLLVQAAIANCKRLRNSSTRR